MTKLNKETLIDRVSEAAGFAKKDVRTVLEVLTDTVHDALVAGDSVSILGGIMEVTESKPRDGVKPGTDEKIHIPARKRAKFRPGAALKSALN